MLVYLDSSKDSLDGVALVNRIATFHCKKLSTGERFQIFNNFQINLHPING